MKRLTKLFLSMTLLATLIYSSFCHADVFYSKDRVYVDVDTFQANAKGDEFYIHTGNNIWLVTNTIHRDESGMFALERNVRRIGGSQMEYQKKWKCPYCYNYWPIGKSCQNPDCPSKYKD